MFSFKFFVEQVFLTKSCLTPTSSRPWTNRTKHSRGPNLTLTSSDSKKPKMLNAASCVVGFEDIFFCCRFSSNKLGWTIEKADEHLLPMIRRVNERQVRSKGFKGTFI